MSTENPNLDDICRDVGGLIFGRWKSEATREFQGSAYLWKGADAQKAFEFEYIKGKYDRFLEARSPKPEVRDVRGQVEIPYRGEHD